jgi:hypothetical protein
MKICLEWFEMPCIGIYSGLFEKLWFLGIGCMSRAHTQYRLRLAKHWERPTKRAITAIIMHSEKPLLIKA